VLEFDIARLLRTFEERARVSLFSTTGASSLSVVDPELEVFAVSPWVTGELESGDEGAAARRSIIELL
jgi:hypothetical protein